MYTTPADEGGGPSQVDIHALEPDEVVRCRTASRSASTYCFAAYEGAFRIIACVKEGTRQAPRLCLYTLRLGESRAITEEERSLVRVGKGLVLIPVVTNEVRNRGADNDPYFDDIATSPVKLISVTRDNVLADSLRAQAIEALRSHGNEDVYEAYSQTYVRYGQMNPP